MLGQKCFTGFSDLSPGAPLVQVECDHGELGEDKREGKVLAEGHGKLDAGYVHPGGRKYEK